MEKSANEGFTGEAWSEMADTQQKGCMWKKKKKNEDLYNSGDADVAAADDGGD